MASRVHAIYNGKEVTKQDKSGNEFRFDFDTTDGLAFSSATGVVEDGVLVLKSTGPAKNGAYDLGVNLNNLDFKAWDYSKVPEAEKARLDLGSDKIYAEMDVRLVTFEDLDSANKSDEFTSACSFLVYYYVAHKEIPDFHTYFGLVPFHSEGSRATDVGWHKDSHSVQMIYNIPMDETFGSLSNAIWQADGNYPIGEWKKIRFDITSHIENLVNLLNKDNVLAREVSRDDLWMSGVNVGFEIWGNYNCEVEFKNFNIIGYDKIEK